ncbi:helix-turn-helix domain-containing protein, partial [Mesomycoplasma ovipneumoniae]
MNKKDLLEKANLTTNCIANMGKNEYISLRNIEKICEALQCNVEQVISFKKYEGNDMLKFFDFCSGIGGGRIGLENNGL